MALTRVKAAGSTGILIPTSTLVTDNLPAGTVVQVLAHQNSDESSTAGTSYVDTGSTITITPKYSNSLIVMNAMLAAEQYSAANTGSRYQIVRNKSSSDTVIYNSDYDLYHSHQNASNQHITKVTLVYNETSGDTTVRTYRIRFSSVTSGGTSRHNKYGDPSVFTIFEVKQ